MKMRRQRNRVKCQTYEALHHFTPSLPEGNRSSVYLLVVRRQGNTRHQSLCFGSKAEIVGSRRESSAIK